MSTIVALSSGRLPAGVAIVRLSGLRVRFALETLLGFIPSPRRASYGTLRSPDGEVIDSGLILFFPAPASFTGEDVAEFHVHGGPAVVSALTRAIVACGGIRFAEPGEFTRRAFLHGKLNLTQAEALADLVGAETEAQRRLAVENAGGAQADLYRGWRQRLLHARAMIEADLDFSDEGDVPGSVAADVWNDIADLVPEIRRHIAGYAKAEVIRDGLDVVIIGAPNAGKSSLLNALAKRDAAIVSAEAGTTRDLIEVSLDLNGYKVRLTDTAGLRSEAGSVEALGIGRARDRAAEADIVLLVEDMAAPVDLAESVSAAVTIRVGTKADTMSAGSQARGKMHYDFVVSSLTGQGLDQLLDRLGRAASEASESTDILPSRLRHVALLEETSGHLVRALDDQHAGPELRVEGLRLAADSLGRIAGSVGVEDLLDVIFSQFCIGK